jgi:hypothetical protein
VAISYWRWGCQYWKPSIYHVTNFGEGGVGSADWKDINGDLPPSFTTNRVVSDFRGYLYCATDYGLYYSTNGGVNWFWLGGTELPVNVINDLVIHEATSYLYIGTYGRGIWRFPLSEVSPISKDHKLKASGQILKSYPNPVVSRATIEFKVKHDQSLNLAVYDFSGRMIKEVFDGTAAAGKTYKVTWNRQNTKGKKVARGNYLLRAIGDKTTLARKIAVK